MTSIKTELKKRKKIIKIAKILSMRDEGPGDYPEMDVVDTKGKKHVLSALDFSIDLREWKKIKAGSKIELTIGELIVNKKIIV